MTKITFIGGGSVLWIPELVNDLALTEELAGAEITLQDIDLRALKRTLPVCRRIARVQNSGMEVSATLDRVQALERADFVVLCVGVGGLEAMRNDLEIPEKYGIYQSVGDTVGPGGLARGLRHMPFAVQLAGEMEELCPEAWLVNLSNPMTTICRAITKSSTIRTVGLCHEVEGVRGHLADLFDSPVGQVLLAVGGINHLPVITHCSIKGKDGLEMLRKWSEEKDPLENVDHSQLSSAIEVFRDSWAVKLSLFKDIGVLFGAGDRHVAEFFPGFLSEESERDRRYGIHLTTADHRQEILDQRIQSLEYYVPPREISSEQLAPLIAALLGGPPGKFVANLPNLGQIDNLPRGSIVECMAYADGSGIWPLSIGKLSLASSTVVAPHVERQELIVEAALTGRFELAQEALMSDPLVHEQTIVAPLLNELLAANKQSLERMEALMAETGGRRMKKELDELNARYLQDAPPEEVGFSISRSTIKELLENDDSRTLLEEYFPGMSSHPQLKMAYSMTLEMVAPFVPDIVTQEKLENLDAALRMLSD